VTWVDHIKAPWALVAEPRHGTCFEEDAGVVLGHEKKEEGQVVEYRIFCPLELEYRSFCLLELELELEYRLFAWNFFAFLPLSGIGISCFGPCGIGISCFGPCGIGIFGSNIPLPDPQGGVHSYRGPAQEPCYREAIRRLLPWLSRFLCGHGP